MRNKKNFLIIIPILIILVGGSYYYSANRFVDKWNDKIYPNSFIRGVDIGGKTLPEAKSALKAEIDKVYNKKITINYLNNSYTLNYSDLNPNFNIDEALDKAFKFGKDQGILERMKLIKSPETKNYEISFKFNESRVDQIIEEIDKKLVKAPKNASIKMLEPGKFNITKEIIGVNYDRNTLKKEVLSTISDSSTSYEEINVKAEELKPEITQDMLKGVNTLVSSYSTSYNPNNKGRSHNIEVAAGQINEILLFPGQTFSFNEKTGKRDESKGYQTAPVIINNKMEDGLGGGVCQVSTTLYNAIIRCNLKSVSRRNHSLAPAYVKPGFDATVSESIDYKFKNTLNYPIFITSSAGGGKITFNIYSDSTLKNIKYDLVSDVYEKEQAKINYKKDPSLPKGKIEEDETPHSGYKVRVYLVGIQDGKEISRTLISKDNYKKVDGEIRIGTKI